MGRTLAVLCSIAALAVGLTTGAAQSASAASGCWYSAGNWWCNNRVGAPVNGYRDDTREEKALLAKLSLRQVTADTLVGEPDTTVLTEAPGNGAALGRIKVATTNAWFAARSSGTEDVYKIYGESFLGPDHLRQVQEEARSVAPAALNA